MVASVQPARLELALLDPQVARQFRIIVVCKADHEAQLQASLQAARRRGADNGYRAVRRAVAGAESIYLAGWSSAGMSTARK